MSEVGLQGTRVVTLVCQCIAASVSEHVRMRLEPQLGLVPRAFNHTRKASGAEGCVPFRREYKGRSGFLLALKASTGRRVPVEAACLGLGCILDELCVQTAKQLWPSAKFCKRLSATSFAPKRRPEIFSDHKYRFPYKKIIERSLALRPAGV